MNCASDNWKSWNFDIGPKFGNFGEQFKVQFYKKKYLLENFLTKNVSIFLNKSGVDFIYSGAHLVNCSGQLLRSFL